MPNSNLQSPLTRGTQVTIQASDVVDGAGNKVNLAINYLAIKTTLMPQLEPLMASVSPEGRISLNAGTGLYFLGQRMYSGDYDPSGASIGANEIRPISIQLDYRKEIRWEVEKLDLIQFYGAKLLSNGDLTLDAGILATKTDGAAKAFIAYMYCVALKLAVDTVKNAPAANNQVIYLTPLPAAPKQEDYRKMWTEITTAVNLNWSKRSKEYFGIDPKDGSLLTTPASINKLILSTSNLGSDLSTQSLRDGIVRDIGGLNVITLPMLGENIVAGEVDKTQAFDLRGFDFLWIHREALAVPFNEGLAEQYIDNKSRNISFVHKYSVSSTGGQAIRPTLVLGFKFGVKP